MKTRWLSMMGIGLAVVCLCLAPQTQAAKGGIPGKPGGEDPPPAIQFQRIDNESIRDAPDQIFSINDECVISGMQNVVPGQLVETVSFSHAPVWTEDAWIYQTTEFVPLGVHIPVVPDTPPILINNYNQVVGTYFYESADVPPRHIYCAALWMEDGTEITLGGNEVRAMNDAGEIVIYDGIGHLVVYPTDMNGDGTPDTWFLDSNGDEMNDLLCPLPSEYGAPQKINNQGQIVFTDGWLLTPDYADANPWMDDGALLQPLVPLEAGDAVSAHDINDLGQIVGSSGGIAVRWDDVNNPVDLGVISKHSSDLVAYGINNTGQIYGGCTDKRDRIAFFYHEGSMYKISDLTSDGYDAWPRDINDNGWIVSRYRVYRLVEQP